MDSLPPAESLISQQVESLCTQVEDIEETLDRLEENLTETQSRKKRLHFGLSLGYRWLTPGSHRQYLQASVSPLDSTLRITRMSGTSYLFSTSVVFDLFEIKSKPEKHIIARIQ